MYEKLLKAVTSLGSPKVLIVGDFLLDGYIYGDAMRISPEAPVPVLKVVDRQYRCGGAGSVAADVAALGAQAICLGVIGEDDKGKQMVTLLEETGADTSGIIAVSDRPTICKERLVGLAQHRHRQQMLRIDDEYTGPLQSKDYQRLLDVYKQKLSGADVVCLQDYNKAVISPELCKDLIDLANEAGKRVLVDPPPIDDYSRYAQACLMTPNRMETSKAVGFEVETIEDAEKAAKLLREKLNTEAIVVTLDKEGAFLLTEDSAEHLPTIPRSVYDVTGAGDMVLATLAVCIAAGKSFKTAVQLSNIAGGIEVEKFGVATVTVNEIVNELVGNLKGKTGKIHTIEELPALLDYHRHQDETIVFTNGCFDVLHRGHTEYLKFCKQQGDIVVLGLNSDSSVRGLKGPTRPINNQSDRAAVLASLEMIDYIVIFDEPDPLNTIKVVKPSILIKGQDWADKGVIGQDFVESHGGKVVLAPLVEGKSSTATIEKMNNQ